MRLIAGIVLACAGPVLADCPTPESVAAGQAAFVAYPDDSLVELKPLGGGKVRETARFDGGGDFRLVSMNGVFIVDEVDMDGDGEVGATRITTTYPSAIDGYLPLRPDMSFEITATNTYADGTASEDEHVQVRTGPLADIEVAGCAYQGFPVLMVYRWYNESFTSMLTHLPALGLSVEVARKDTGMEPVAFAPRYFGLTAP